ncbi:hypothetical protein [Peterkaempfera bronchialis]|uniref:Uncharacterized protein n=1 Tax=Peterkaempfera bronchialis TaxID=2126346 RepID=A0A345T4T1_9ACTN|nr:hypothetical protein [Peterkaempfera bronchialis]AXI80986.1 hypothetical protein C7M71_030000 [Peterkaempfera bronchialis]
MPSETDAVLDRWGVLIARTAAPDEIDFAAQVTRAYAAGGRRRQDLFRTSSSAPGSLGGDLATLLPTLLDALAACGDVIRAVLASPAFANTVSAATLLATLSRRPGRSADSDGHPDPDPEQASSEQASSEQAVQAAFAFRDDLVLRGLPTDQADRIAAQLLAELLRSDPADAAAFLIRLTAREPARPAGSGRPGLLRRLRLRFSDSGAPR